MTISTDDDPREVLAGRLVDGLTGAMETLEVYLGVELGLYRALHDLGGATESEVAGQAGVPPGTPGNGSSSRRSPATSPATTRPSRRPSAATGCRRVTPRCWSTPTAPGTSRRSR
jgi:hypothetical protein